MSAVWMRIRAEARTHLRAWIGLALLIGLFGGGAMSATAASRRTSSAYARFAEAARLDDELLPDFTAFLDVFWKPDFEQVRRLPQVAVASRVRIFFLTAEGIAKNASQDTVLAPLDDRFGRDVDRMVVDEGRLPDPRAADEISLSASVARERGLHPGARITVPISTTGEISAPARRFTFKVVGVHRNGGELLGAAAATGRALVVSRAFAEQIGDTLFGPSGIVVRLRPGADAASFDRALDRLGGGKAVFRFRQADAARPVERALGIQAIALWLMGGLTAIAGVLIIAQALARQTFLEAMEHPTLRSLGFEIRHLALVDGIRALAIGVAGAAVAVGGATLTSVFTPFGEARLAEPQPGVAFDAAVAGAGALSIVVVTALLAVVPAIRAARTRGGNAAAVASRRSFIARLLGRTAAAPSVAIGVKLALESGRGRTAVPVRTAIAGATLALGSLAAALTFAASLGHVINTPRLYGIDWDVEVTSRQTGGNIASEVYAGIIDKDQRVEAWALGTTALTSTIDGHPTTTTLLDPGRGTVVPPVLEGRMPAAADEIVLGTRSLDKLGKRIGGTVRFSVEGTPPAEMRIVGRAVVPATGTGGIGEGAILTQAGVERSVPDAPPPDTVLFRFKPGVNVGAAIKEIAAKLPESDSNRLRRPEDVAAFGRVSSTPVILAALFAVLAAATLGHALLSSIRRRRRDLAVLITLGFLRRQVRAAVAVQATALVVVALCLGLPLGVAAGRWGWDGFASEIGFIPEPVVAVVALALTIPGTLLLANVLAAVPARIAARTSPAIVLRAE